MRTLLLLPLLLLAGCANFSTRGVSVENATDQIVKVEFLQLNKQGEMVTTGTQILSPGGAFQHKIDDEERTRGSRIRFMLDSQTLSDANWVMLNLPATRDRAYELKMVNNRLTARDLSKRMRSRSE